MNFVRVTRQESHFCEYVGQIGLWGTLDASGKAAAAEVYTEVEISFYIQ